MILACQNINKSFGTDVILSDVSFHINDHEKAAIVGINGAGKSTLLKIITGEEPKDSGQITLAKDATLGYLAQTQDLNGNNTIYDEVLSVKADVLALEQELRDTEHSMKGLAGEELDTMLNRYTKLTHEFENKNGYAVKSEVTGVLKGLGFTEEDFKLNVATLSGGQKTRVALSKLLLKSPDIIMLDEPTNHLDMAAITWLEGFLSAYKGAVVIVAHDRYFLDKIVTKVIEIDNTKAISYEGNYTAYAEKRAQIREIKLKHYLNQQREIKHQEAVIEKLKSFNREKSIKRAESREKMLDKIERVERPVEINDKMDIRLEPNVISGNDVLTVKDLSKSYGDNVLFTNASFEIKRGEHVAIIGANGTGKTTLLRILNGIEPADTGEFKTGAKVSIGYYDQEHHVLSPEKTIFDEIQDTWPNMDNTKVRNCLAAFLFTGDDVYKQIKDLSGGERGRVSLAKLMLSDANLLILDEPTNHLDITSKEILEQAISKYEGTVICVSHDRYFINRTATRILELANRKFYSYGGNYDYYLDKRVNSPVGSMYNGGPAGTSAQGTPKGLGIGTQNSDAPQTAAADKSAQRLDWEQSKKLQAIRRKLENDFKKCEEQIAALEAENEEIDTQFADPSISSNSFKLNELNNKKTANEEQIAHLMEVWEELYEKINLDDSALLQ